MKGSFCPRSSPSQDRRGRVTLVLPDIGTLRESASFLHYLSWYHNEAERFLETRAAKISNPRYEQVHPNRVAGRGPADGLAGHRYSPGPGYSRGGNPVGGAAVGAGHRRPYFSFHRL